MGLFKNKKEKYEISEVADRLGIRISTPHGYLPEDVDKLLIDFEAKVNSLNKEINSLEVRVEKAEKDKELINAEYTQLKIESRMETEKYIDEINDLKHQISLLDIPESSMLQDEAMMSKLSTITGRDELSRMDPVEEMKVATQPLNDTTPIFGDLEVAQPPIKEQENPQIGGKISEVSAFDENGDLRILTYGGND